MRLGAASLAVVAVLAGSAAQAQDKRACAAAYDDAQSLRKTGRLVAARAQLITCAAESCPVAVRKACSELLPEVDAATPQVTIGAKDAEGKDTLDVRVVVDGAPFVDRLVTTAMPIDPGEHAVTYEAADGSRIAQRIVVREGERKQLMVDFSPKASEPPAAPVAPKPAAPALGTETELPPAAPRPSSSPAPWIAVGIGGAALVSFGVFALLGRAKERDLLDHCAPNCAAHDVSTMRRDYLVADISLLVATAAAGVVTWLFVAPPRGMKWAHAWSTWRF
jgi:hypothetical protein